MVRGCWWREGGRANTVAGVLSFEQGDVIIQSSSKEEAIYFGSHFESCQRNWKRNYMKQENRGAIPFMVKFCS